MTMGHVIHEPLWDLWFQDAAGKVNTTHYAPHLLQLCTFADIDSGNQFGVMR